MNAQESSQQVEPSLGVQPWPPQLESRRGPPRSRPHHTPAAVWLLRRPWYREPNVRSIASSVYLLRIL